MTYKTGAEAPWRRDQVLRQLFEDDGLASDLRTYAFDREHYNFTAEEAGAMQFAANAIDTHMAELRRVLS